MDAGWSPPRRAVPPGADEAAYQEKLRITRTYFPPDAEILEFGVARKAVATG